MAKDFFCGPREENNNNSWLFLFCRNALLKNKRIMHMDAWNNRSIMGPITNLMDHIMDGVYGETFFKFRSWS